MTLQYSIVFSSLFTLIPLFAIAGIIYPFRSFKRRWVALVSFLVCLILAGLFAPSSHTAETALPDVSSHPGAQSEHGDQYWVTSERLNRRTCPSLECGIVGQLFFREGVSILERRNDWVRISERYDASCVGGRSEYVFSGNAACESSNGIIDGQFAEWVSVELLSENRPSDPAADASGAENLVVGSDDFARYRTAFAEAAQSLIAQRRCTEQDFHEIGGWLKSTNHRSQPIYFTYCGGFAAANRLYLNADTGEIFR